MPLLCSAALSTRCASRVVPSRRCAFKRQVIGGSKPRRQQAVLRAPQPCSHPSRPHHARTHQLTSAPRRRVLELTATGRREAYLLRVWSFAGQGTDTGHPSMLSSMLPAAKTPPENLWTSTCEVGTRFAGATLIATAQRFAIDERVRHRLHLF
jgi:hypothetical protein